MGSGSHDHGAATTDRRRLVIAIAITVAVLVVEVVGALVSGSLALLADAGHMTSDLLGLGIALVATIVAARPATDRHTFGFQRGEVLGALVNGLILAVVAVYVAVQGVTRLLAPEGPEVDPGIMLLAAGIGLVANVGALLVLRGGAGRSINMRGAYLEVLGDAFGSVATIVAGVVIAVTGFGRADAVASLVIAALIVPRAVVLLRDVVRVLNESTPVGTEPERIRAHLLETPGVTAVHDVHVWAITSGSPVFTAHVVVEQEVFRDGRTGELLDRLSGCLDDHFDVEHSTFQLEPEEHAGHEHRHHV
ncbi:cation diffusion facilitator family transporter [Clavibacter nebraskensis]|uniref:Cation diffusion facilitator family transporter n=2 Tax=Clavibacter nebraskensis TaxID=31963 RepID=A0A399QKA2_9MICO|nr:cation diffusion facilitator family transporter [Clavibacter nebraskensis]KXU20980.1 cation transporter [Clavibacter nebraskensis]OAH22307.1 cation transporter [Clavibacter nebraskensis]QGV66456.1 cation transporter [Clavibacter nebraskensis]QGV69255.1 cation transporter [Clavibacter nebraskensis]QGV72045.1 cation transporter [Clavibacter nebraskensis]